MVVRALKKLLSELEKQTVRVEDAKFPPGMDTPEVREALQQWIDYRRQRKPALKTMQGLNEPLKRFSDKGPERLCAAIEYSMGQQSQGIYEDRSAVPRESGRRSKARVDSGGDFT